MIQDLINSLNTNLIFKIIIIAIMLDCLLGSARAIKERKWNSTIGIDGIIRKFAMITCVIVFILLDDIMNIDLLFFIPNEITDLIHLNRAGITEFFGIMFILYEITSILKNMVLCGLPVPNKVKDGIEKLLNNMTTELNNSKKEG